MRISPDAVLFGLRLMEQGSLSPEELAETLRQVAGGEVPDHLVALEESVLTRHPGLSAEVTWLGGEPFYVPVDCSSCRGRFRVRPDEVDPSVYCPLCGEPIMQARRRVLLGHSSVSQLRAAESEAPFAVPAVQQRFAHFSLLELLGRGGAGKVYKARNLRSERTVALKLLDIQPLEPAARSFQRLRREARVAASITHRNIVRVFDLGVAEGVAFVEMELVRGVSLKTKVRQELPPPAEDACRLCLETLAGLAAVHERKIVHGDIKPGNILIDRDGRARLTDFGISRFLEETTSLTTADRVVGSPHFMAPEQWRGEALTPATDLYALALVLYFALTGRLPWEGQSRFSLMYKHLHEPLLAPREVQPHVPDYLGQVIRRGTEKDPEERFESAEEFAQALRCFPGGRQPG